MSPRRRDCLRALLAAPLFPALNGCGRVRSFVVSAHNWPGYELLFLAAREGWIDDDAVHIIESTSATESMQRLQSGEVDAAALTLDEAIKLLAQDVRLRAVLVFNISSGADALVAKAPIAALDELAGKRVGVEDTAVGALMLASALSAAGLSTSDITTVPLTVDQHLAAWKSHEVDALVSFEPVVSKLKREGGQVLFDSTAMPDTIIDILAVSERSMADAGKRRALQSVVRAHFRALRHLRANPADAAYRLAARLGGSGPAALQSFRGLILPDEPSNHSLLGASGTLDTVARSLASMMFEWGHIERIPVLEGLVDNRALPRTTDSQR